MEFGPYAPFIVGSYGFAALVLGALLWLAMGGSAP